MKKYNYVYKITNLVNGKIYIGKHSTDKLDDGYMGSGIRLHQAYKKYGLGCFTKEVIDYYNNEEELNRGEIYWIAKYNSTDLNIGYNLTYGGEGEIPTEEVRRKMSEAKKGKHHLIETIQKMSEAKKGKVFTEEHRRKISEAHKGKQYSEEYKQKMSEALKGKNNPMYGKTFTEESKRKMAEARKLYWQKRKLEKLNQQINDTIIL